MVSIGVSHWCVSLIFLVLLLLLVALYTAIFSVEDAAMRCTAMHTGEKDLRPRGAFNPQTALLSPVSTLSITNGSRYSWHSCIQRCQHGLCSEDGERVSVLGTTCYLRNVCVDTRSKHILYFHDPQRSARSPFLGPLSDPHLEQTQEPFLLMHGQAGNGDPTPDAAVRHGLRLELVAGQYPSRENTSVLHTDVLTYYGEVFVPDNFGHLIADTNFSLSTA